MPPLPYPRFKPCVCGSGRSFSSCCGPFLDGEADAPTAEKLMRSRYAAYALRREEYVLRTWHSSTRPPELDLNDGVRWTGLTVKRAEGGEADETGTVEFEARYVAGGRPRRMREVSRFGREDGRWRYVDGDLA